MRIRPWTYLAIIATVIIWGLPGIILWMLTGVMLVDAAAGWIRGASRRVDRCLRAPLTGPLPRGADGYPGWQITRDVLIRKCAHHGAVEVRRLPVPAAGVEDDVVAWWCPDCETQLPADWVRDGQAADDRVRFPPVNAEQLAAMRAAFLRGQQSAAPVWIRDDGSPAVGGTRVTIAAGRRHTCELPRCRTIAQIEATGRHAVEVTAVGDPHRMYVPGRPLRCESCGGTSISPVAPLICIDCGRGV